MTESERLKALIAYRLTQADEALNAAQLNLDHGLNRSAINRAYYAMFYAVLGLLAVRQQETSRHSGALALFDRDYVKPGTFSRDFSRWLHAAFEARQDADYGDEFTTTLAEVRESVDHAREFIIGVREHLTREGFGVES